MSIDSTVKPSKSLGQNFLRDQNVIKKIVRLADLSSKDAVLEIGPGTGFLTKEMAKRCKKIIAVEKDKRLISILKENLKEFENVSIVNEDILIYKIRLKKYKVVASLPYYVANLIIRELLTLKNTPSKMVLVVQKEVAQRICQKPPRMNLLALGVQSLGKPKILSYISKRSFTPVPKVDGAILEIIPEKKEIDYPLFFNLIRAGFVHPRKQLANNLAIMLKLEKEMVNEWLRKNKIKPEQRAETLRLKDWIALTKNL